MEQKINITQLYEALTSGDRVALGQAITLVESAQTSHREQATELLDRCLAQQRNTFRFAVSGSPGVGKSTFIEAIGERYVSRGHKLAVLAVDPSSPVTRGAILGDKTRMTNLARNPGVFIRPSSAGTHSGGVAGSTREVIVLCEAAGYDRICIETVGVGQSELAAQRMTDLFLLLQMPGGGDDLQGIKKGIVEMADLIVVTKSDGDLTGPATQSQRFFQQSVHLAPVKSHGISVEVLKCSALANEGIDTVLDHLENFCETIRTSGYMKQNRHVQNGQWLEEKARILAQRIILSNHDIHARYSTLHEAVVAGDSSVTSAIRKFETFVLKMLLKNEG